MKFIVSLIILIATASFVTLGIDFETECDLAKELMLNYNLSKEQAEIWACLSRASSDLDNTLITTINETSKKGTFIETYHGMFQFVENVMCSANGTAGGYCNSTCEDVRSENITTVVKCAKQLFAERGYNASDAWFEECEGYDLTIEDCNLGESSGSSSNMTDVGISQ